MVGYVDYVGWTMNDTDDIIRDLAKANGVTDLAPEQIHDIRNQVSNGYIDAILDGRLEDSNDDKK